MLLLNRLDKRALDCCFFGKTYTRLTIHKRLTSTLRSLQGRTHSQAKEPKVIESSERDTSHSMTVIAELQPKPLWEYFERLSQIPRPSKHEEKYVICLLHDKIAN